MSRTALLVLLLAGLTAGQNLLYNGDFELPLDSGWTRHGTGIGVTEFIRDSTLELPGDPDFEAEVHQTQGPGSCWLEQVVAVNTLRLRFTFTGMAYGYRTAPSSWAVGCVCVRYCDSAGAVLGETRYVSEEDLCNWEPSDRLSLYETREYEWVPHALNILDELAVKLAGVDRNAVAGVSIRLMAYTAGEIGATEALVQADNITLAELPPDTGVAIVGVTVLDTGSLGNGNGRIDRYEAPLLRIELLNIGDRPLADVSVRLRDSYPNYLDIVDSLAVCGDIPVCSTRCNISDPLQVRSFYYTGTEDMTLVVSATGFSAELPLFLDVGTPTGGPVPDGPRTPSYYFCYDDSDSLYYERPYFDWVEIRDIGTRLTLSDDQTCPVSLPSDFTWYYYDQVYHQVSICSNGFVAAGSTTISTYTNTMLPTPSMPPMVAVLWDDFNPARGGGVYYYCDRTAVGPRFIVEYDSVPYYSGAGFETFELIIWARGWYDIENDIVCQYKTANHVGSTTVGLQDPSGCIGIQCLYNGSYHRSAAPLHPGHAILYATPPPCERPAAVLDDTAERLRLSCSPNPSRGPVRFALTGALAHSTAGLLTLSIFDHSGRLVRTLLASRVGREASSVIWDGRDERGQPLPAGIYFCRARAGTTETHLKLALTR